MCLPRGVNIADLKWGPTGLDCLEVAMIEGRGDPFSEPAAIGAKFGPGCVNDLHTHTYQYEAVIWQGQFQHYIPDVDEDRTNLKTLKVGDAYSIPAGQVHQDINPSQTEPSILFIYFYGPFDYLPEGSKPK